MKSSRHCILSLAVVCLFSLRFSTAGDSVDVQQDYARQMAAMHQMAQPPQAVNPATEIVFPRVANGVIEGLRIITTIAISSTVGETTTASIRFFSESGGSLSVTLYNSQTGTVIGRGSEATVFVPGYETVFVETDGVGGVVVGWASISTNRLVGATGSFQYIVASNNQFLTAVGVGGTTASPAFFIPLLRDEDLGSNTALALTNISTQTAFLKLFLFENNGTQTTRTLSIGPRQSYARFINEIFSVGRRFFGTLHVIRVDSAGNADPRLDIFPIALFTSKGILSSLPATNLLVF